MSTATIIMVVLICVGCATGLSGLGYVGYRAWLLMKTVRAAGISSRAHVQQVMGRAARLAPRVRDLEAKQRAVAEGLSRLSATTRRFR